MKPRIKQEWLNLLSRFDALKPREQILLAVAGAAIVLVFCDQLFWTPLSRSNTLLQNRLFELRTQLSNLQTEHSGVKARLAEDPDAELRRNLDTVKQQIDEQNKRLAALTVDLIPPEKMATVLRDVLKQRDTLRLIALQNEPATYALMPHEKPEATADRQSESFISGSEKKSLPVVIFRHGLTVQLKGRYTEIVGYLQTLEQLPWHFYWEKLDYKVEQYPEAIVTLKIYTLSYRESWIGA